MKDTASTPPRPQAEIIQGDCLEVMREMQAESVDSIVTDPPYALTANKKGGSGEASVNLDSPYGRARIGTGNGAGGFMGKAWDSAIPGPEIWAEALRVAKPGAHLLAFSGTRTWHRLACAIEDAGWEIRDTIASLDGSPSALLWIHGQGFPKSKNLGDGRGSALKPAFEPVLMARKPLTGTLEATVSRYGTGAINIAACRIAGAVPPSRHAVSLGSSSGGIYGSAGGFVSEGSAGRWPANVVLSHVSGPDGCREVGTRKVSSGDPNRFAKTDGGSFASFGDHPPVARAYADADGTETVSAWVCHPSCPIFLLDQMSGERPASYRKARTGNDKSGWGLADNGDSFGHHDTGGASRYFLQVKPDKHGSFRYIEPCEEIASNVGGSSTPSPTMSGKDSGGSVPESAGEFRSGEEARPTPGDTSANQTDAGIGSGASREAGSSTISSSLDGPGSEPTAPSPKATRSTTKTKTPLTTPSRTSPASPPAGTTTTTSASERITESSTASGTDAASDARNTNPSLSSPSDDPAPSRDIASPAPSKGSASGERPTESTTTPTSGNTTEAISGSVKADRGDELRFKYCAKASRAERERGLEGRERKEKLWSSGTQNPGSFQAEGTDRSSTNHHPTVKNLSLMRWLCRLITPPMTPDGKPGLILDPFAGSGSTLCAGVLEGFRVLGIEAEPQYVAIAERRLAYWSRVARRYQRFRQYLMEHPREPTARAPVDPDQGSLFGHPETEGPP